MILPSQVSKHRWPDDQGPPRCAAGQLLPIPRALDLFMANACQGMLHCVGKRRTELGEPSSFAVKARIDQAWHHVSNRCPHMISLVEEHGLEKTGEAVFERGRRAVVFYECEETSQDYVARYFVSARRWLGHQLGEQMQLKCACPLWVSDWLKHTGAAGLCRPTRSPPASL
jgi:hypothetical protein